MSFSYRLFVVLGVLFSVQSYAQDSNESAPAKAHHKDGIALVFEEIDKIDELENSIKSFGVEKVNSMLFEGKVEDLNAYRWQLTSLKEALEEIQNSNTSGSARVVTRFKNVNIFPEVVGKNIKFKGDYLSISVDEDFIVYCGLGNLIRVVEKVFVEPLLCEQHISSVYSFDILEKNAIKKFLIEESAVEFK